MNKSHICEACGSTKSVRDAWLGPACEGWHRVCCGCLAESCNNSTGTPNPRYTYEAIRHNRGDFDPVEELVLVAA